MIDNGHRLPEGDQAIIFGDDLPITVLSRYMDTIPTVLTRTHGAAVYISINSPPEWYGVSQKQMKIKIKLSGTLRYSVVKVLYLQATIKNPLYQINL